MYHLEQMKIKHFAYLHSRIIVSVPVTNEICNLEKQFYKAKKKKLLDSQTLFFSKNRCVLAAFYFYFYFPVGYILGHFGLFG